MRHTKTYTIRKIYKGNAELRGYDVKQHIQKKETIKIVHEGGHMILTPEDLAKGKVINTQFGSMTGKKYLLIGFEWRPL